MIKRSLPLIILFSFNLFFAQKKLVSVHSHNDYEKKIPFWQAFAAGATSIEADVVFKDGKLYVAHEVSSIKPTATLEDMYLRPLKQIEAIYGISELNLQLMIDVKTEAYTSLDKLIEALAPYKRLLKPYKSDGVSIVISGNRPNPEEYGNYPQHIYFDCQEIEKTPETSWNRVAMISMSFKNISQWNGLGRMVQAELDKINAFIDTAKKHGKPVRFWDTPDTKTAWKAFYNLDVGFINTDMPGKAIPYLLSIPERTYVEKVGTQAYMPTFSHDTDVGKIKNFIFLIGDGMGLAQVSAGDFMSDNGFHMSKLKSIGFIRTQSADNFGTDSAAGATAFATGKRTNNRAIGTDVMGNNLDNIIETLSKKNYTTGIVTTDKLTGATPAAYYAHVKDRGETGMIARYLVDSPIDFFVGAGKEDFGGVFSELKNRYVLLNDIADLKKTGKIDKVGLFLSDGDLASMENGRGDLMPRLVKEILPLLKARENPFFVMIEGAKIDSYGHSNDVHGIVREVLDFDSMVGEAIRFADLDGETLVVVTADHETGGFSLSGGNIGQHVIEGDFTSHDHTGTMVPVFAYGPGASLFQGVYDNIELYHKMSQLLNVVKRPLGSY